MEKLGNLTEAGTAFVKDDSDLELAASIGLDPGLLISDGCQPQVLLLPFGDKDEVDWPIFNGTLLDLDSIFALRTPSICQV